MKKKIIKFTNRFLGKLGLRLEKIKTGTLFKSKHVHDPQYSYLESPILRSRLNNELAEIAEQFFSEQFPEQPVFLPEKALKRGECFL